MVFLLIKKIKRLIIFHILKRAKCGLCSLITLSGLFSSRTSQSEFNAQHYIFLGAGDTSVIVEEPYIKHNVFAYYILREIAVGK